MAATTSGFFAAIFPRHTDGKSKAIHDIAVKAYRQTGGPTENLRAAFAAYMANKAKAKKRDDGTRISD